MELQYIDACERCMHIYGMQCQGHEVPSSPFPRNALGDDMELCNNCGQHAPRDEINFAGFCRACQ
jgi:hypothetical protein